jgi:hypothetical protein
MTTAQKVWWKSKTIIFNAATIFAVAMESSEVVNVIPEAWQGEAVAVAALINIVLRTVTTKPVTK